MLLRVLSLLLSPRHTTDARTCWKCLDPHVLFAHSAQSPNHHSVSVHFIRSLDPLTCSPLHATRFTGLHSSHLLCSTPPHSPRSTPVSHSFHPMPSPLAPLGFFSHSLRSRSPLAQALRITSLVVDAFFWVDIVCNFATAYEVRGVLETSPRKIARRYLTGWFACDLVSTIPYEEIMISSGAAAGAAGATGSAAGAAHAVGIEMASDAAGYVKLLKLIRLVRLFRVMRLTRIFSRMDITLGLRTAQVTLVKHLIFIITIAHWYACLLYLVAQLENFSPRSWVNQVRPPIRTGPRYLGEQYIAALYWSITTMATIGYGDIVPKTTFERVVITFVELTAVSFYAYAVTNVVTVIAGSNREAGRFKELIDETNEWMGYRQLPTDIRLRVREYLMHRRQTIMLWHERELLADFS